MINMFLSLADGADETAGGAPGIEAYEVKRLPFVQVAALALRVGQLVGRRALLHN